MDMVLYCIVISFIYTESIKVNDLELKYIQFHASMTELIHGNNSIF